MRIYLCLLLAGLGLLGCATIPPWSPPLVARIEGPDDRDCASAACVDLLVAVDTSGTTRAPVGGPEWTAKGELFGYPPLGPNSRLMVALDGLERAVNRLDRERFAVMLVGFAGDPYRKNEAVWYESGLTSDRSATGRAAARMRSREPAGWSCHACAVFEGARALRRFEGQHRCPLLVLLTDSDPNLPATPWDSSDFTSMNLDAIAKTLRSVSPLSTLFVVIDDGNPERAAQFAQSIGEAGSRAVLADDAGQVADAIVGYAGTCRG